MHLNDGLADEGSAKEGPEGNEEVTTRDTCQIKQRIGDLEGEEQPCKTGGGRGLGSWCKLALTDAHKRIPKNPTRCTSLCTAFFALVRGSFEEK